mgnify:CR=1 FL=1
MLSDQAPFHPESSDSMRTSNEPIRRVIFVGTYPPRQCGIATFTQDLLRNMQLLEPSLVFGVYAINQNSSEGHTYPDEVLGEIIQDDRGSYLAAAEQINKLGPGTLVIIQHEYGIYGNEYLIGLMQALNIDYE